ncbi:MAG: hypothetical protein ACYDIC_17355 [Desulfobaccales bacterium]
MAPAISKIDKVIVTNFSALNEKYGNTGSQTIQTAVQNLIASDQGRGLVTGLYRLDDRDTMRQYNAAPVTIPTDPKQNKDAVDAIYKALAPDYILILGSIDIIPHQDLQNPMFSGYDEDKFAFGDLPYACESAYSQNPKDFFGPTRVVGRLPDITGAKDPKYLIDLLKISATYQEKAAGQYHPYFGISAGVWEDSTESSISIIFGNSKELKLIPPKGPSWSPSMLNRFAHFINCHGALADSHFYGQPASGAQRYPIALDAANLEQNISEGTVVAAECCYGAQLFDPAENDGQSGICNTYLGNKAYGFFGSTTIAYGPADSNDQADLICRYFLQSLLQGASLGRATLEARQKFIHTASMYDPSNIKTIAQFNLYADPAVTPVKPKLAPTKGLGLLAPMALRLERVERRRDFFSRGLALAKSQPSLSKEVSKPKEVLADALNKAATDFGLRPKEILTFKVKAAPVSKSMPLGLVARETAPSRIYVVFGTTPEMTKATTMKMAPGAKKLPSVVGTVALIIKEVDGTIAGVKKIYSR